MRFDFWFMILQLREKVKGLEILGKNIYIVTPVLNEGPVIGQVVSEVRRAGYKNIIVVDDGSTDDTAISLRGQNVIYLRHAINRGKGAATKTGFEAAKMKGADIAVTIDGDGQHYVSDIKKLIAPIEKEGYDVVLGSRSFDSGEVPPHKVVANMLGNFFVWVFYGLMVKDSQSGLRAYSKRALSLIDTKTDRYEYDGEVIREIRRNRLKYKEIPISVKYTEHSKGKKNKQGFINGIKTLIKMALFD